MNSTNVHVGIVLWVKPEVQLIRCNNGLHCIERTTFQSFENDQRCFNKHLVEQMFLCYPVFVNISAHLNVKIPLSQSITIDIS